MSMRLRVDYRWVSSGPARLPREPLSLSTRLAPHVTASRRATLPGLHVIHIPTPVNAPVAGHPQVSRKISYSRLPFLQYLSIPINTPNVALFLARFRHSLPLRALDRRRRQRATRDGHVILRRFDRRASFFGTISEDHPRPTSALAK